MVYHLDFRFQLAILGQKIASTLGGVGGPKSRVRALWTQSVHHWTHLFRASDRKNVRRRFDITCNNSFTGKESHTRENGLVAQWYSIPLFDCFGM